MVSAILFYSEQAFYKANCLPIDLRRSFLLFTAHSNHAKILPNLVRRAQNQQKTHCYWLVWWKSRLSIYTVPSFNSTISSTSPYNTPSTFPDSLHPPSSHNLYISVNLEHCAILKYVFTKHWSRLLSLFTWSSLPPASCKSPSTAFSASIDLHPFANSLLRVAFSLATASDHLDQLSSIFTLVSLSVYLTISFPPPPSFSIFLRHMIRLQGAFKLTIFNLCSTSLPSDLGSRHLRQQTCKQYLPLVSSILSILVCCALSFTHFLSYFVVASSVWRLRWGKSDLLNVAFLFGLFTPPHVHTSTNFIRHHYVFHMSAWMHDYSLRSPISVSYKCDIIKCWWSCIIWKSTIPSCTC